MKKFYFLFGISLLSLTAAGQTNRRDGESVDFCRQHVKQNELMSDPQTAALFAAARAQILANEAQMSTNPHVRAVKTIPIVFHVIHKGSEENISREQILDQLFILNRDYRLQNDDQFDVHNDFKASNPNATCIPSDAQVEFVLATKAPNGTVFSGITRTYNTTVGSDGNAQYTAVKNGNNVYNGEWPFTKYLNVIISSDIGGAAGYTFNPGSNNTVQNCIYILHNYVGSIGTSSENTSRALTHEIGHWLDLSHTWGGTNEPGTGSCGSDGVNDTPVTQGVTSCNLNEAHCGPRANVENYMDYSYCSKMFSQGQVDRMQAALQFSTRQLWQTSNLTVVGADGSAGASAAVFSANQTSVCAGAPVTFTDESFNNITGWSWTFEGGTPATSTLANPTVTFATAGPHDVKLVVTDGSGSATTNKPDYIKVFNGSATIPFLESFETLTAITDNWIITNPGNNAAWTLATNTGSSGSKSAKLGNFGQPADNVDELISSPVDLSGVNSTDGATMSFRYAYRKKATANDDALRIYFTKTCGETWDLRRTMTASLLSTAIVTTDWTPASTDFVTVHMTNLTSAYWTNDFRYKFEFTSGGGNNIYIDDINIYEGAPSGTIVLGVEELAELDNAVVFPNPADEQVNVRFSSAKGQKVDVSITDVTGKVLQQQVIQAAEGSNLVVLSTESLASGMYLIRFNNSGQTLNFMVK